MLSRPFSYLQKRKVLDFIIEVMAHTKPIISSNAGGIPEVNLNGKTGFISNIGDTDSMINNAMSLLVILKSTNYLKNRLNYKQKI